MTVITGVFSNIALGLTPLQRLDAITKYHSDSESNQWFIAFGLTIVAVLTALLLIRISRRKKNAEQLSGQLFDEYADAKALTDREYRLLMNIATNAGLRQNQSIFTLPSAFDREAIQMVESTQTKQGTEKGQQLRDELNLLREKLDFHHCTSPNASLTKNANKQSTQQLLVKKKIYIKANHSETKGDLEATVLKNTSAGITVQFRTPVEIVFGQAWICRYYSGAFVAEFNTTVAKCSGHIVVLNHSNHVRLINRRRFLRVPVQKPAYVASFPFKKESSTNDNLPRKKMAGIQDVPDRIDNYFEPPRFVPATVTELGGPGLRISTNLSLNVGDRVLLMFKLDQNKRTDSVSNPKPSSEKIIEHIANVRHITNNKIGRSVAIELTGLNDKGIDELIRATNEASICINKWRSNDTESKVLNQTEELLTV